MNPLNQFWKLIANGGSPRPKGMSGECVVHMGTVGWDEVDEHADIGTAENDGFTFVRVTLYAGRQFADPHKPDIAQGHKILCNIGSGISRIPPKGTRCFVLMPVGLEEVTGSGCIFQTIERSPQEQFSKDRITMDFGSDKDLVIQVGVARLMIKRDGTASLLTTDSNNSDGKVVGLSLSTTALKFTSPWGSFNFDATGFHLKTKAGPRIDMGGFAIPGISSLPVIGDALSVLTGYFNITSPMVKIAGSQIFLGSGAVFNPVTYAPVKPLLPPPMTDAVTGNAIQSQSVWCSV